MKTQSQPATNVAPTVPPTPVPAKRKRKMSAQHRANLKAAAARRKAMNGSGNTGGITTQTGNTGGSNRLSAIETLRSAARGNWSAQQINQALTEARKEVAVLEALERAAQHTQPERAMTAGGSYNQG